MKLEKIKVKAIPDEVKQWCEANASSTTSTFCAYLEYKYGEIVERAFACRRYKKQGVMITEVRRRATGGKSQTIFKNLVYARMSGYIPIYEAKTKYENVSGYHIVVFKREDFDVWDEPVLPLGFWVTCVNPMMLFDIPEFKYCGYTGGDVIGYLDAYRRDSKVELFGKMGLAGHPELMRRAKADSGFRRFVWENHVAIGLYGTQAAIFAYNKGCTVEEARRACCVANRLNRLVAHRIPAIKGTRLDRQRVLDYVDENNIPYESYNDYLTAIKELKLNLEDTKNVFPHDFARMHDLRTAEYAAEFAKIDARKRKKLYNAFREKAKIAQGYEAEYGKYMIVAPKEASDLVAEGMALSHCVGRMGYDKKMADGISLIMFLRKKSEPDIPFVTIEYRLDRKALNQCYGYHDSKPSDDVMRFANRWARNLTKTLKEASYEKVSNQI